MGRMRPLRVVREMMHTTNTSQRRLSQLMGRSPSYVGTTLSRDTSIEAENLISMANAMGYRVLVEGHGATFELSPHTLQTIHERGRERVKV